MFVDQKVFYKDGEIVGIEEMYDENGQLRIRGRLKDGKQDGLLEYFNEDGSLEKTETYKDGVKVTD